MCAKDYRKLAWNQLSGNWGLFVLAYIILTAINSLATLTGIGGILVTGPLMVGFAAIALTVIRGGKAKIEDLFSGFTSCFVNSFLANLLTTIYTMLWCCLFIVPGIIAAFSYSMTSFILKDHPEMSATDAIAASKAMMKGHKWQLFCLYFSFIGWWILTAFTCGLLSLLVIPYTETAVAAFYENIKGEPTVIEGEATEGAAEPSAEAENQ